MGSLCLCACFDHVILCVISRLYPGTPGHRGLLFWFHYWYFNVTFHQPCLPSLIFILLLGWVCWWYISSLFTWVICVSEFLYIFVWRSEFPFWRHFPCYWLLYPLCWLWAPCCWLLYPPRWTGTKRCYNFNILHNMITLLLKWASYQEFMT